MPHFSVHKKEILSHSTKLALLGQLELIIRNAGKSKEAYSKLLLLYSGIDIDALIQYSSHLNKSQFLRFAECVNPHLIAQKSPVRIEVCRQDNVTGRLKTNGRYILYFRTTESCIQVRFAHRSSFVVYLMYLIDKCHNPEGDALQFDGTLFEQLMKDVYAITGEQPPKRMKDCLWDINKSIRTACRTLGVPPSPYVISGEHEHLYVLRQDIILPEELM